MPLDVRDLFLLTRVPGVGQHRLRALVNHFRDPRAALEASAKQLAAVEGIERKTALAIVNFARSAGIHQARRYADEQLSRMNKVNGHVVTCWDAEYPAHLRGIYDPPPFLFVRGRFTEADNCSIAIVGTRRPTPYGTHLAEIFAADLATMGISVVSGLARGIDTVAHRVALREGGRTVGVIGSGIDLIYPPENRQLAEAIVHTGAVLSEFEMGAKPDAANFPKRNRLISGITLGTLVVETGTDGGAMITASTALDQNREVFAVPAAVTDKVQSGANRLIKEGKAKLTESVEDIIAELAPRLKGILNEKLPRRPEPPPDLTLFERKIIDVMGDDPVHIDRLADRSGLSASDALVQLLSLEFKGIVRQMPGKMFSRK